MAASAELCGWFGRYVEVDLSTKEARVAELSPDLLWRYMGGRGLGSWLVSQQVSPSTDPFSRENLLVFAVGPLTATLVYTSGRVCVVSKSPLTNGLFYSSAGGFFGAALKQAGYDALVVKSAASKPSMIVVDGDVVEVVDCEELWGKSTSEVREAVQRDLGRDFRVACIGPAGENLVRIANISVDPGDFAGRGGLGAVMGSKKLKAIAVRGEKRPRVFDEEGLRAFLRRCLVRIKWKPVLDKALSAFGTSFIMRIVNSLEVLPTKNFLESRFEKAQNLYAEVLSDSVFAKKRSCFNCPIACKRVSRIGDRVVDGPEYESLAALGPMLGLGKAEEVVELNRLCNELGIDTISAGVSIACAIEASQRGLLPTKIKWGDFDQIRSLLEDVAYRVGLGSDLAEGSKRFASKVGASDCAMEVKGLEVPMYDPRGLYGQALGYATSNRGACHLNPYMVSLEILGTPILMERFSEAEKPALVAYLQNLSASVDSMVLCKFLCLEFDEDVFAQMLAYVTGKPYTHETVVEVGERIWNLERAYNLKCGITPDQDKLPKRLVEGVPLEEMLGEYYRVRGWSGDGYPTPEKLKELGVESS